MIEENTNIISKASANKKHKKHTLQNQQGQQLASCSNSNTNCLSGSENQNESKIKTKKKSKARKNSSSHTNVSKESENRNEDESKAKEKSEVRKNSSSDPNASKESEDQNEDNTKTKKKSEARKFPEYWTRKSVEEGLEKGELFKGSIRISKKNNRVAYVSNKDPSQSDYLLPTAFDRNRALYGDVVAIQLKPRKEWSGNKKTASVVYIMERIHSRTAVGVLHKISDPQFAIFTPHDYRIPKIRVIVGEWLKQENLMDFYFDWLNNTHKNILCKAKIKSWNDTDHAIGSIVDRLGKVGDLDTEIRAIIEENNLVDDFLHDFLKNPDCNDSVTDECLQNFSITETEFLSELNYRKDLRKECIFTIDPLSAHDIDDAISCKRLSNGNFEVGVHISDVTFYLKEGTPLDKEASKKATSAYLVRQVLHMMPKELCSACSLLPGTDKITFSVLWEITLSGEIIRQNFFRSVINSCSQLAYEHVQALIENPYYQFKCGKLPQIFGDFTVKDLSTAINYLNKIATNLRAKRFENGAIHIGNIKLEFKLDRETKEPVEFNVHENKEANKLIEEFMLLANQAAAQQIKDTFPQYAFLRCHHPANEKTLESIQKKLKASNINLEISSSKALQQSIWKLKQNHGTLEIAAINHLVVKAMNRAQYFCAENIDNQSEYFHYGLHVPLYTHFTSPIRRYADVVVHRLLESSLGYSKKRLWKAKQLKAAATQCNKQRWNAKCAQEDCNNLYLAHYIEKHQPFIQDAIVVKVTKKFFDVLVPTTGSVISVYPEKLGEGVEYFLYKKSKMKKYILKISNGSIYLIHLFAVFKVKINRKFKTSKLEATLV